MTEQYLRHLYYESPVAYTGFGKLWSKIKEDKVKITREQLKKWLEAQDTYSLHKPARKRFPHYRKVIVHGIDDQWQADIVDMQQFARENKGYKYLLTVIDILSKYAWVRPLRSKRGDEMADTFRDIFRERKPDKIQFDEGREFYNSHVKELFTKEQVEWFSTRSDKKASVVERFNRTLKGRMYKYFTEKATRKWIDILPDLVRGYNETTHSSIKMKPAKVDERNEGEVWYNLYGHWLVDAYGPAEYNIGDLVRISKYKHVFSKGYLPNYTEEKFKVRQIVYGSPIVYKLEDLAGEEIEGIFYEQELSRTAESEYKVEKILRRKKIKGVEYGLVKWKGYGPKFNSWEPMKNIHKI